MISSKGESFPPTVLLNRFVHIKLKQLRNTSLASQIFWKEKKYNEKIKRRALCSERAGDHVAIIIWCLTQKLCRK